MDTIHIYYFFLLDSHLLKRLFSVEVASEGCSFELGVIQMYVHSKVSSFEGFGNALETL